MDSPQTHLAEAEAAQKPEVTCAHCGAPFKPKTRHVARFCKNTCRQAFHTRQYRIEAIRERALAMFEALRIIAGETGTPYGTMAAEAIKDLKAP